MAKSKKHSVDNALKAALFDPMFRKRIVKSKKGTGSYTRKKKGREAYSRDLLQVA